MFFSRSSATSSFAAPALAIASSFDDEPTPSFRRLSISHDDILTSSCRSDSISSSATFFSAAPVLLIASSDKLTFSFRRFSFSHDDTPLCWFCDAAVHDANFLVARHVHRLTCDLCRVADSCHRFSSPSAPHPSLIHARCLSSRPADPPCPSPFAPAFASALSSIADVDDNVLGVGVDVVELSHSRCGALEPDRRSPRWGDAVVHREAPWRHARYGDRSRSCSFSCSNGSGERSRGGMGRVGGVGKLDSIFRRFLLLWCKKKRRKRKRRRNGAILGEMV